MSGHFKSVVLDVDSTLSGIEGIDWLASLRGEEQLRRIASLTQEAMEGGLPLEQVYGKRLAAVRPRRNEIDALGRAYVAEVAPGAPLVIRELHKNGVQVVLVSGGIRSAIIPLAMDVGIGLEDLHAVRVRFDALGAYAGYDSASPLTTSTGKRDVVAGLSLPRPILAVGDGSTDVAMRDVVDTFGAFTGFATRQAVVDVADVVITSFPELLRVVLAGTN